MTELVNSSTDSDWNSVPFLFPNFGSCEGEGVGVPRPQREYCKHTALAQASADKAEKGVFKTAPFDPRFPNQNLTRYCYQSYIDFQKCKQLKGDEHEACQYFHGVIKSICPKAWLEKWDTQVEEGVFVGNL